MAMTTYRGFLDVPGTTPTGAGGIALSAGLKTLVDHVLTLEGNAAPLEFNPTVPATGAVVDSTTTVHATIDAALADTSGRPRRIRFKGGPGTVYKFNCKTIGSIVPSGQDTRNVNLEITADPGVLLQATTADSGLRQGTLFEFTGGLMHGLWMHHIDMLGIGHGYGPVEPATATQPNVQSGIGIWIHDMPSSAVNMTIENMKFRCFGKSAFALCDYQTVPNVGEPHEVWNSTFRNLWARDCGPHNFIWAYAGPCVLMDNIVGENWLDPGIAGPYTEDGKGYGIAFLGRSQVRITRPSISLRGGVYAGNRGSDGTVGEGASHVDIDDADIENYEGGAGVYFSDGSGGKVTRTFIGPGSDWTAAGSGHSAGAAAAGYIGLFAGQPDSIILEQVRFAAGEPAWRNGYPIHTSAGLGNTNHIKMYGGFSGEKFCWSEYDSAALPLYGEWYDVTRFYQALVVNGDATTTGIQRVGGNLIVAGAGTTTGAHTVGGVLAVTGAATVNGLMKAGQIAPVNPQMISGDRDAGLSAVVADLLTKFATIGILRDSTTGTAFGAGTVSGLKLWLRPDLMTASVDGDSISLTPDSSGNGNVGTSSGSARPIFKTGIIGTLPALRFNTSAILSLGNPAALFPTAGTMIFVGRVDGSGATSNYGGFSTHLATDDQYWKFLGGGYFGVFRSARLDAAPGSGMPSTGSHIWTVTSGAAGWALHLDGSSVATSAAAFGAGSDYAIGHGGGCPDVAEMLLYNKILSGGELTSVWGYLTAKYGL